MEKYDLFKRQKQSITIDELKSREYKQEYFEECKYIWKNYVPKSGQADNLQGELLREAEALRCEAQDNGNINWDYDHAYFCDFIRSSLNAQSIFSDADKEEISLIMNFIKECGLYAQRYNNSKCPDENVDIEKLAYTEDNLYDIICDKIGRLQKENSRPIPYRANDRIKR